MKPSPETPLDAYIIAEAAERAGLPPGVLNLVPAHREAADYLVRNPGVDKISFTGSTAAGRRIASVARRAHRARHARSWRGKSAAIVLDDMPVAAAAKIPGAHDHRAVGPGVRDARVAPSCRPPGTTSLRMRSPRRCGR